MVIKKFLSTEKSFNNKDKGIWTFSVNPDADKSEIKKAVEALFSVKVDHVNTGRLPKKVRNLRSRIVTRRRATKIARVKLSKDSKALDLTKLNK